MLFVNSLKCPKIVTAVTEPSLQMRNLMPVGAVWVGKDVTSDECQVSQTGYESYTYNQSKIFTDKIIAVADRKKELVG